MAGFDTVDPAYACVLPVSFKTLFWRIAITPKSRLPKHVRTPTGSSDTLIQETSRMCRPASQTSSVC
jgi:hypothetical protein